MQEVITVLKALGHTERLRIVALLGHGELTISELVQIMGLSQPRVTQYVQTLETAGLVERLKEGSWVLSRLRRQPSWLAHLTMAALNDTVLADTAITADLRRLSEVRELRAQKAQLYFAKIAEDGGQPEAEYIPQRDVEAALRTLFGASFFTTMVDLGTGTGRMLALMANQIERGFGVDSNIEMLRLARHRLAQAGYGHLSVRQGDLMAAPLPSESADLVCLHQVLHYLDNPLEAISEMARLCAESAYVVIVDYAAHNMDIFRDQFAHRRLGFSDEIMSDWMCAAGITLGHVETIETDKSSPDVKIWLGQKTDNYQPLPNVKVIGSEPLAERA